MLAEKRINRFDVPRQLRTGETLARAVRRIAALEQRPIGQQILVLVMKGVEQYCRESGKEISILFSQF